jgi:hypothetical protein
MVLLLVCILGWGIWSLQADKRTDTASIVPITQASPAITSTIEPTSSIHSIIEPSPSIAIQKSLSELVEQYGKLRLMDAHNHDAGASEYIGMESIWKQDSVDRVVIFGNVSESSAI